MRFRISFPIISHGGQPWKSTKKTSVKKQYEIENISSVINAVCENKKTKLVDFGSGLGYLDHFLFEKYGFSILGLEGSVTTVEKAKERQKKFHSTSLEKVKHIHHFITSDSADFILNQLEKDDTSPVAIFGLHGCGDLTVVAINL